MMGKFKSGVLGSGVFLFLALGFYRGCVATSNEIGFIGADKAGRQILIQSWDYVLEPKVRVTSEYYDRPYVLRLFQEPMRTTVRFEVMDPTVGNTSTEAMRAYLSQPAESFISQFKEVSLREDRTVSQEDLLSSARKHRVETIEDLLGAFGFKTFEVMQAGTKIVSISISQKSPNTRHVGE